MNTKKLTITALFVIIGIVAGVLLYKAPSSPTDDSKEPIQSVPKATAQSSNPAPFKTATPTIAVPQKESTPEDALQLRFKPTDGQTLAFQFESESNAQIDFTFITPNIATSGQPSTSTPTQGQKTPVIMQTSGELYLKYFALEPEVWQVAGQLANVSYLLNQQTPRYAQAIAYPFAFQMNTRGFLSRFQFTKNIPTEARQFVEQLLYTLQIAFPTDPKIEWRTKEIDKTGRYQAAYHLTGLDHQAGIATVTKQKKTIYRRGRPNMRLIQPSRNRKPALKRA